MRKRTIISVFTIVTFAIMGLGFAMWSDTVAIGATAKVGEFKFNIQEGSAFTRDQGIDWTCEYGLKQARYAPENKGVGFTDIEEVDTNGDGYTDTLNVSISNAYPCYYNDVSWWVENSGTIPLIIQKAKLAVGDNEGAEIEPGTLYILCRDDNGSCSFSKVPSSAMNNLEEYYKSVGGFIEFKWGNNVGLQMHPGDDAEQSFKFHVVQSAQQDTTYNFSISIDGVQWNESPIKPINPLV